MHIFDELSIAVVIWIHAFPEDIQAVQQMERIRDSKIGISAMAPIRRHSYSSRRILTELCNICCGDYMVSDLTDAFPCGIDLGTGCFAEDGVLLVCERAVDLDGMDGDVESVEKRGYLLSLFAAFKMEVEF